MVGRKIFLLSFFENLCFILSAVAAVTKTHFPLHPALSRVVRGTMERLLAGWSSGSKTRSLRVIRDLVVIPK